MLIAVTKGGEVWRQKVRCEPSFGASNDVKQAVYLMIHVRSEYDPTIR